MNQRAAFLDTLDLACKHGMDNTSSDQSELDYPHLADMYQRIIDADNRGEPFSDDKIGRWLGWAQAAVVAGTLGAVSLSDMKAINEAHK